MSMRIRFQFPTGERLGYSIERLSDRTIYDFTKAAFGPQPADEAMIAPLPEGKGPFKGRYEVFLDPTPPTTFTDGDYCITVHDQVRLAAGEDCVKAELATTMNGGDDGTPVMPGAILRELGLALGRAYS